MGGGDPFRRLASQAFFFCTTSLVVGEDMEDN
jgi:hypothetical protein